MKTENVNDTQEAASLHALGSGTHGQEPSMNSTSDAVGGGGAGGVCPKCAEHKQAVIDAMSLGNDLCEQREQIIRKLMRTCYDEANRIANHCSDGAARLAMHNLYEAANVVKSWLEKVGAEEGGRDDVREQSGAGSTTNKLSGGTSAPTTSST